MNLGLTVRRADKISFGGKCSEDNTVVYILCRNGRVLLGGLASNIEVKNELKVLGRLAKSVTVKPEYVIGREKQLLLLLMRFEQKRQKFWLL